MTNWVAFALSSLLRLAGTVGADLCPVRTRRGTVSTGGSGGLVDVDIDAVAPIAYPESGPPKNADGVEQTCDTSGCEQTCRVACVGQGGRPVQFPGVVNDGSQAPSTQQVVESCGPVGVIRASEDRPQLVSLVLVADAGGH